MSNRARIKSLEVVDPSVLEVNEINEYLGHFGHTAKVFLENTNDIKKPDCGQEVFDLEMEILRIKKVPTIYNYQTFEGYSGAYQQTGFDPFSAMIPNGFVVIGNPDWYIPDNFISYIDENRKISVFVNNVQYGLTSTPTTTTAGGVTESVSTAKSLALTDDID